MAKINCLNPIAACGMDLFNDTYEVVDDFCSSRRGTCQKCSYA